jgi:hypothetical protein
VVTNEVGDAVHGDLRLEIHDQQADVDRIGKIADLAVPTAVGERGLKGANS